MAQRPNDPPDASDELLSEYVETEEIIPKFICPNCKQKLGVNIIYGYPSEELAKQAERNEIVLGGCMQAEGQPDRQCLSCGHQWEIVRRRSRSKGFGFILIESEGILYRGPNLRQPTEVWHHTRKEWVRNCFLDPNGETDFGVEIDEQRADDLKNGAGAAEHFMYYDTPPWLQV